MKRIITHKRAPQRATPRTMPTTRHTAQDNGADLAEKLNAITQWLEEHKAENVVSINLTAQNSFADAIVVATASSVRHAQALADGVGELCHERKYEFMRVEGQEAGQWVLVDLNDIVVNIFQESARNLYRLEDLWGRALQGRDADSLPPLGLVALGDEE